MVTVSLTLLLVLLVVTIAVRMGGPPERLGAAVVAAMLGLGLAGRWFLPQQFDRVDPVSLTVDLAGFAAFLGIGIFAWRLWPLCAASMQLLAITAHLVRLLQMDIHPFVYALLKSSPTYLILLLLLAGTAMHRRRVRRNGSDRSWRSWSAT